MRLLTPTAAFLKKQDRDKARVFSQNVSKVGGIRIVRRADLSRRIERRVYYDSSEFTATQIAMFAALRSHKSESTSVLHI